MSDVSAPLPPAGWFDDPTGGPHHRWWDGAVWTERVQDRAVTAALPEPRLLRAEVIVVMVVAFLASTYAAAVLLLRHSLDGTATTLERPIIHSHPVVDVAVQVVGSVVALAPVLLVWYVLQRTCERFATIGLIKPHWLRDTLQALGMVVLLFIVAVVVAVIAHAVGIGSTSKGAASSLSLVYLPAVWATSIRTALVEEVLVTGYLLHRLRQLGWSERRSLGTSMAVRCSYHLYGGPILVAYTLVFGLILGRIWQKTNRLTFVVMTHALYDGILFTLTLATRK